MAAITAVRDETDPLAVTWSVLHTDPAPEAFIHDDRTGVTGLIDWAGSRRGPVLYDLASAVMYLGGPQHASAFLSTYLSQGPLTAQEMQHLDAFRRFREAVQGAYFAGRLASNDLTGGIDRADNEKGLDDARRRLGALGLGTVCRPMPAHDLGILSEGLRSHARVDPNGEVSWHVRDAPAVLEGLAGAGRVVLGLDIRDYAHDDGTFREIVWSDDDGADPIEARDAALEALARDDLPGDWALITWRH